MRLVAVDKLPINKFVFFFYGSKQNNKGTKLAILGRSQGSDEVPAVLGYLGIEFLELFFDGAYQLDRRIPID